MEFEINAQREAYLATKGKIVLNACPGSGKTTTISKKLIELQKEYRPLYGKYSGVACLSFTNTAKDEINEKYTQLSGTVLGFPHKVSTIDSFINQYITLPFYYLINKNFKRPKIIDDLSFIDDAWKAKYRYKGVDGKLICFSYPPSTICFEIDGTYSSNGKKPKPDKVDPDVFTNYCSNIKKWQISNGLISTGDSAHIALYLLKSHPKIGNWLVSRFPHIIIDEAQDNSKVQHDLFDKLLEQGLNNLELIGDPYQSLFEWRDAKPQLFLDKYMDIDNWQALDLTDNRRSPQRIIDCFSLLRCKTDQGINSTCNVDKKVPIFIYKYTDTNSPTIVRHFEKQCQEYGFNKKQIVVRGNALKNKMLGKQVEQKPWKSSIPYSLIEAVNQYTGKEIKDSMKSMRALTTALMFPDIEVLELKERQNNLKYDHLFNALLLNILHDTPKLDKSIANWTNETQVFLKEKLNLQDDVDFELKNRNSKYFKKTILEEPVDNHFKKSYSKWYQRRKNQPKSSVKNQPPISVDVPVRHWC